MSIRHKVALLGFSAFERATFESFFRLAGRRSPAYDQSEVAECDLAIVDADQAGALASAASLGAGVKVLFIGARAAAGHGRQLARPVNLMQVLNVLDEMTRPATQPAAPAASTPAVAPTPPATAAAQAAPAAATPAPSPRRDTPPAFAPSGPVTDFQNSDTFSNAVLAPGDDKFDHILVVDDSDLARRFIESRLKRFGFKVHLARSGEEAIERIAERQFEFVFLDVMMEGMDGYMACKTIKRMQPPPGRQVPVVVMLTSKAGAIDRIRGTLAGCDAYLTKPLIEDELVRVISTHDAVFQRGFESTYAGGP